MKINNHNGFTLVETLIYIALIGITLSSFISFGLSISALRNKSRAMEEVQSDSQFAIDLMARTIRKAKSVQAPVPGETAASLSLLMPDNTVTAFALEDGILKMDDGSGSLPIAGDYVSFPLLEFANLGDATAGDSVRIKFTAKYKNEAGSIDYDYEQELQTAVGLKAKL